MLARSLLRRGGLLSPPSTLVPSCRRSIVTVEPADAAAPIHVAFSSDDENRTATGGRRVGLPIVMLHGLFGSKNNFKTLAKTLNRDLGNQIFTVDARNHGDSVHRKVHDYTSMAGDIVNFIEHHKLGEVTLLGHSMGAKTAMATALLRPDLVGNLIVVDNAPVEAQLDGKFGMYARAMKELQAKEFTKRSEADAFLAQTEPNDAIRAFLLANLKQAYRNDHRLVFRCNVENIAKNLDLVGSFPFHPDKVRFEKPALFVRGTRSPYVPDETIPVIGQFFPKFRMKDVEAGHWVISENFPEFVRVVEEFLEPENEKIREEWKVRTAEKQRRKDIEQQDRLKAKEERRLAKRTAKYEESKEWQRERERNSVRGVKAQRKVTNAANAANTKKARGLTIRRV